MMAAEGAVHLGRCRRVVEPLRVVITLSKTAGRLTLSRCRGRFNAVTPRTRRPCFAPQRPPQSDHRHRSVAAPIRPVHKSPSLTVAESSLPTAISMVEFTVPNTSTDLEGNLTAGAAGVALAARISGGSAASVR
jgi:hypothetical protein